jgi:uncharacterized membrane protein YebE (DUF533 family)
MKAAHNSKFIQNKTILILLCIGLSGVSVPSFAQPINGSSVLGGGAGAAVGSAIGGRNGAMLGGAVGAVAGVAIATPKTHTNYQNEYGQSHEYYGNERHGNHHRHHGHHEHHD